MQLRIFTKGGVCEYPSGYQDHTSGLWNPELYHAYMLTPSHPLDRIYTYDTVLLSVVSWLVGSSGLVWVFLSWVFPSVVGQWAPPRFGLVPYMHGHSHDAWQVGDYISDKVTPEPVRTTARRHRVTYKVYIYMPGKHIWFVGGVQRTSSGR